MTNEGTAVEGDTPFSVDEAIAHLRRADPVLGRLIDRVGPFKLMRRPGPYASLIRTILFQQLAGAAAFAIQRRFFGLYGDPDTPPSPQQLLEATEDQLRAAGVSRQKAGYLHDLALRISERRLDLKAMPSLSDDDVIQQVTEVKGLGEWSAHMFLMFHLGRPDILPAGDLGVRNGMRIAYGLDATPTPSKAREIGAPWAPYRSVASWYMWRAAETVTPETQLSLFERGDSLNLQ